jgi:VanZ family protein
MFQSIQILPRWLPALLVMLVIFVLSSLPSAELLYFDWADRIVKKGGHMIGYGILAVSYWHALSYRSDKRWLAWLLAVLYALTDEFHQSFVPGRNASLWDVVVFDNLGALFSLWIAKLLLEQKRPDSTQPDR